METTSILWSQGVVVEANCQAGQETGSDCVKLTQEGAR